MMTFASGISMELSPTLERKMVLISFEYLKACKRACVQRDWCRPYEWSFQRGGILAQGEDVIGEHNHFIFPKIFVVRHQVLTRHELVRVHAV